MSAVEEAAKAAAAPECLIMGSTRGFLRRVPSTALEQQNRGGKGECRGAWFGRGGVNCLIVGRNTGEARVGLEGGGGRMECLLMGSNIWEARVGAVGKRGGAAQHGRYSGTTLLRMCNATREAVVGGGSCCVVIGSTRQCANSAWDMSASHVPCLASPVVYKVVHKVKSSMMCEHCSGGWASPFRTSPV
jgi:hypothetical protein